MHDADANAQQAEMDALREDVAPTWLAEPLSLEETAERYVRPALRNTFVDLCRQPVAHYLDRFGFRSDLLRAMYAVTDGFSGLNGTWDTPGTGMNFLVHNMVSLLLLLLLLLRFVWHTEQTVPGYDCERNDVDGCCTFQLQIVGWPAKWHLCGVDSSKGGTTASQRPATALNWLLLLLLLLLCSFAVLQCRLPNSGGTWMVVEGGMGAVTQQLAAAARQAGAHIHTGAAVQQIEVKDGRATGAGCSSRSAAASCVSDMCCHHLARSVTAADVCR
jgi:hypothetical protein